MRKLIIPFCTAALLFLFLSGIKAQTVSVVAGNGNWGFSGDGGPALQAAVQAPNDVALDNSGNLYICASNRLRKVNTSGIITSVAGNGNIGFNGDGGPAILADYKGINCVATDINGNIYVSDSHRIRKINSAGIVNTIAGTGVGGFSGDGGPATSAQINYPDKMVVDGVGNIYFSDAMNNRIRKISTSGSITTIAGTGVAGFSGDGGPATSAQLNFPTGIALDATGNLYVADHDNHRLRKITPAGIISTVAGGGTTTPANGINALSAAIYYPPGVAVDAMGNIYVSSNNTGDVYKVTPSGTLYILADAMQVNGALGIAATAGGTIYTACQFGNTVRKIVPCTGPPAAPDTVWGSTLICTNSPYTYNVPTVYTETLYYTWTLPTNWNINYSTNDQINTTTSTVGGNIAVTATNLCGTSAPYLLPVAMDYSIPIATAMVTDTMICDSYTPVLVAGTGPGYQYRWYDQNMSFYGDNDSFWAANPGDYTVVVTNAGGCNPDTSDAITISYLPYPSVTPNIDTAFCLGGSITYAVNSTWATSYQWRQNGVDIPGATAPTYTATTSGYYNVRVSGYHTCSLPTVQKLVTVHPSPLAGIVSIGNDTTALCPPSFFELLTYQNNDYTYVWQHNGVNIPGETSAYYTPTEPGIYTVVTSHFLWGCDSSASIVVLDSMAGPPDITTSGTMPICDGDSILLETPYNAYYEYYWMLNGFQTWITLDSVFMAPAGTWELYVNDWGCMKWSAPFVVASMPAPTPTITQAGQQLSVPAVYISYQWYLNGNPIPGATSDTYTPTQSGDYHVVVYDGGCDGPSNTVNITLSVNGLSKNTTPISLYPNPNNGVFTFTIASQQALVGYQVLDVTGKLLLTSEIPVKNGIATAALSLPQTAAGVYTLRVSDGNQQYHIPFVKQ